MVIIRMDRHLIGRFAGVKSSHYVTPSHGPIFQLPFCSHLISVLTKRRLRDLEDEYSIQVLSDLISTDTHWLAF